MINDPAEKNDVFNIRDYLWHFIHKRLMLIIPCESREWTLENNHFIFMILFELLLVYLFVTLTSKRIKSIKTDKWK